MAQKEDQGWAWVCLLGSFYIHFLVMGWPQTFGVILVELIDYFSSTRAATSVIPALLSGLFQGLAPLAGLVVGQAGSRMPCVLAAFVACCGCVLSFFASSILFLCMSVGVLVGLSFSIMNLANVVIINRYFKKRLSLANAIGSMGGGIGALVLPLLFQVTVEEYTWRGTMLITGGLILNCAVFGALFRPWKKSDDVTVVKRNTCQAMKSSIASLKNLSFLVFLTNALLGALVVFVPFNCIPDYSREVGIPLDKSKWIISTIGISGIFGRLFFGFIADWSCINRTVLYACSSIVCGLVMFLLPSVNVFIYLLLCAVVFGIFLGVWWYLHPVLVVDTLGAKKISLGFGIVTGCQGLASLIGMPLAGWLYDITGNYNASFYFAGSFFVLGGSIVVLQQIIRGLGCLSCVGPEGGSTDDPQTQRLYPLGVDQTKHTSPDG